jgi:hypothetical protein
MTRQEQNDRVAALFADILRQMRGKNEEYASEQNALRNFEDGAALMGVTPGEALFAWAGKHIVSVRRMVSDGREYPPAVWREKCGDIIAYTAILYAMKAEGRRP